MPKTQQRLLCVVKNKCKKLWWSPEQYLDHQAPWPCLLPLSNVYEVYEQQLDLWGASLFPEKATCYQFWLYQQVISKGDY